jgi:toxin CcdB
MARLDLYRIAGLDGYLLEVQADILSLLGTTVVVPLLLADSLPRPMLRLNPLFEIDGKTYVMATQSISAIARKELGTPVAALNERAHFDITNALDMLLLGV